MALEEIIAYKKALIEQHKSRILNECQKLLKSQKSLAEALRKDQSSFIFEIKPKSPSKGVLKSLVDVDKVSSIYEPFADAISVLADEKFFGGSLDNVKKVSSRQNRPVLCKDVVVSPLQILEARAYGANVVLLMLSVLTDKEYRECEKTAQSLGMEIITEVHTEDEMARAKALEASIIGINNRDLFTLKIDLETTERLVPLAPKGALLIAESGFYHRKEIMRYASLVDGFLVGSSLMQAERMDLAVRELIFGRIKICGLTNFEDANHAYQAGAYYGGLNFWPKSKRHVRVDEALMIKKDVPLSFGGVFVDQPLEEVRDIALRLNLDFIQLHGHEPDDYILDLKKLAPTCEIWQTQHVKDGVNIEKTNADRVLLDTFCPQEPGGTGKRFAWAHYQSYFNDMVVAGGVNESNILELTNLFPFAIDICSGMETDNPRKKSLSKIDKIFDQLRPKKIGMNQ